MKKTCGVILAFALVAEVGTALYIVRQVRNHGAHDFTGFCVNNLSSLLLAEPSAVDPANLGRLLERYTWAPACTVDGWGNPIRVRVERSSTGSVYWVTSYGSDGKAGPGNVYPSSRDHRLDWVLRNGQYVR